MGQGCKSEKRAHSRSFQSNDLVLDVILSNQRARAEIKGIFQMFAFLNHIYKCGTEDGEGFGGFAAGNFLKSHSLDRRRMAIVRRNKKLKRM